jgi:hypothetical protein
MLVGPAGPLQFRECKHLAESETANNSDITRCLSHRLVSSSASPSGFCPPQHSIVLSAANHLLCLARGAPCRSLRSNPIRRVLHLAHPVHLSTREAAVRLSIGASTLKKLRVNGGGPAFHGIGRRVVYSTEILDEGQGDQHSKAPASIADGADMKAKHPTTSATTSLRPWLSPDQRRQMQKLAERVDRVTRADAKFPIAKETHP